MYFNGYIFVWLGLSFENQYTCLIFKYAHRMNDVGNGFPFSSKEKTRHEIQRRLEEMHDCCINLNMKSIFTTLFAHVGFSMVARSFSLAPRSSYENWKMDLGSCRFSHLFFVFMLF